MHRLLFQLSYVWTGAVTRDEEEFVTEFRHLPEGWLAVGALALIALLCWSVFWMYRHEGRIGSSQRTRTTLSVIRCLVLLLLAVILLEPVRVRILRRWIDSYVLLLVDESSSMDLTDTYRDRRAGERARKLLGKDRLEPTQRSAIARELLETGDRQFLRELADKNRIKLYTFSDEPRLRATVRATRETAGASSDNEKGETLLLGVGSIPLDFSATGPATDVGRAIRRAVDSLGSAPVAGVIVVSDGGFNQGASADEVARLATERRLPIYTVGVGDPARPYNARITELLAPPNAFQEDPFSVTVRLAADGLDGKELTVHLRERNATQGGVGRIVATRAVQVGAGGAIEPVVFQRTQERIGRFTYVVEVVPLEGESVRDDNIKQTTVNVIDARTRVLILAGGPSWEYRFVSRLLERDETFDVSCWLQTADLSAVRDGNTIIDHLPITPEELFEYDVILMLDPDPAELDDSWSQTVDTLVTEYGGGLLYAAARPHAPDFFRDRSLKALHDLMPVTIDPEADIVLNEVGHYQLKPAPLSIPSTAFGHPIMRMAGDVASTKLAWKKLGDVYWHYPVRREKPVATVLMRHGDPKMQNSFGGHILGAVQFVGAGRSAFLGIDGTWRWRGQDVSMFDRFWVQLVRHLAEGKLLGGTKRGMLLTESDQYALGESVTVTARLMDRRYKPLKNEQVTAHYSVDQEKSDFVLSARGDRPGWFEGRFVPRRTGNYHIELRMPGRSGEDPLDISREILVARPNIEVLRPQMDRAQLITLAQQSEGGRYFEVDEVAELPGLIPDLHEEISIRSRPSTLWDDWKVLTLLLTLLTLEWGVRKWNRML